MRLLNKLITNENSRVITRIDQHPQIMTLAAKWFSQKFSVSEQAYLESMNESLSKVIPKWFVMIEDDQIIGGIGIIDNDFHERIDLWPNLCALYVEPEYRQQKNATKLVNHALDYLSKHGINKTYLLTDHLDFYEKLSFKLETVISEGRIYSIKKTEY